MTEPSSAEDAQGALKGDDTAPATDWVSELGESDRRAVLKWVGENLPEIRQYAYGHRFLYRTLAFGFVLGLVVYAGGYAIRASVTTGVLGFAGDLLYTLGWALWTGVVVVLFLQVIPEVKQRQYRQALEAYETAQRDRGRGEGGPAGPDDHPEEEGEPEP